MAFSADDLQAINDAIATGANTVKYQDRTVIYNSLSDLLRARDLIRAELGVSDAKQNRHYASFSKGLFPHECD